jgi:hypothetical protein
MGVTNNVLHQADDYVPLLACLCHWGAEDDVMSLILQSLTAGLAGEEGGAESREAVDAPRSRGKRKRPAARAAGADGGDPLAMRQTLSWLSWMLSGAGEEVRKRLLHTHSTPLIRHLRRALPRLAAVVQNGDESVCADSVVLREAVTLLGKVALHSAALESEDGFETPAELLVRVCRARVCCI